MQQPRKLEVRRCEDSHYWLVMRHLYASHNTCPGTAWANICSQLRVRDGASGLLELEFLRICELGEIRDLSATEVRTKWKSTTKMDCLEEGESIKLAEGTVDSRVAASTPFSSKRKRAVHSMPVFLLAGGRSRYALFHRSICRGPHLHPGTPCGLASALRRR